MSSIADNLRRVRDQIDQAATSAGRDPDKITLLAVSKTFSAEVVEEAAAAGQLAFGENRVQEGAAKVETVGRPELLWHLIGHLQSNKSRLAARSFDVIQTVDSLKLAKRLAGHAIEFERRLQVFVQVNVGNEEQKAGVEPAETDALVAAVEKLAGLELVGLMAIPPFESDPEKSRPHFSRLRLLLDDLNRGRPQPLTQLSMGMSGDFRVALEEGSTVVRLGTAIFGPRAAR